MAVIAQSKKRLMTISTETPSLQAFGREWKNRIASEKRPSHGFAETDEAEGHHGRLGAVIETSVVTGPVGLRVGSDSSRLRSA
jgi:hypothetical protein